MVNKVEFVPPLHITEHIWFHAFGTSHKSSLTDGLQICSNRWVEIVCFACSRPSGSFPPIISYFRQTTKNETLRQQKNYTYHFFHYWRTCFWGIFTLRPERDNRADRNHCFDIDSYNRISYFSSYD